jgi:hypothetical protein
VVGSELLSELPAVEPGLVKLSKGEDSLMVSVMTLQSLRGAELTIATILNRRYFGTYSTWVLRWKHGRQRGRWNTFFYVS